MKMFPPRLAHSSGAAMVLDRSRLLLAFKKPVEPKALEGLLKPLKLEIDTGPLKLDVPGERVNNSDRRVFVRAAGAIDDDLHESLHQAGAKLGLDWTGPVYRLSGADGYRALLAPLPNVLLVRVRRGRTDDTVGAASRLLARPAAADIPAPVVREVPEKSRYLNEWRYFMIDNPRAVNAYQLREQALKADRDGTFDIRFETMPYLVPTAVSPNDPLFAQQWSMTQIDAGGAGVTAWDIGTGNAAVVACVLDEGCDLTHPDLTFSEPGIRLDTMLPDGSPTGNHGTPCAGIVAGSFNNALGVAGVAGACRIMPVAFVAWTDVEVAAGINYATTNGADVISMSFGWDPWDPAIIDPAILNASSNDVVMCVATHNHNGSITYPATNPLVMACGASDQIDNRKSPASPDGEAWGSNFGPEISVVAPGVLIPSTDRQGAAGYNAAAGVAGDYVLDFNGTSSATPHVAGLAALIRSAYPALTAVQVRALIERTAEKVGVVAYAETPGNPSGTWNQEMGYGRINAFRALDCADVFIKDNGSDTGVEPSTGNFWDFSDIVVRITDDNIFNPTNPTQSKNVERGQANYIYVQVTNNGPHVATNVTVSTRLTPYVGLQFAYPADWTLTDAMHVVPAAITASFASIPAAGTALAKFRIEAAQTETLYGWETDHPWHPCLLANVNADNDYAFATAPLTGDPISTRRNNLAQRNLTVIDVLAGAATAFPFVAGNRADAEPMMTVTIDRSRLPKGMQLLLSIDDDGSAFPLVDFTGADSVGNGGGHGHGDGHGVGKDCDSGLVFLHRTRVRTRFGCCEGELTLEKGSRFDCVRPDRIGEVTVTSGDVIVRGGRRYVELMQAVTKVRMVKTPGRIYPMSLHTRLPAAAKSDDEFAIQVSQQNTRGVTVGGAAVVYIVK